MKFFKAILGTSSYILMVPFALISIINFVLFIYEMKRKISDNGLTSFFHKIPIDPTCTGIGIDCLGGPFYTLFPPWIFLVIGCILAFICYGFYKLGTKLFSKQI